MCNCTQRKFERVCEIVESYGYDPEKLIPILQDVQKEYRYLPEEVMTFIASAIGVPPSRVYGVATFFAHFSLKPKGKYVVRVCDGTACHVKGSTAVLEAMRSKLKLSAEEQTTKDMLFTVETVSCLGACGLAPVIMVNDDVYGEMTAAKAVDVIEKITGQEAGNEN